MHNKPRRHVRQDDDPRAAQGLRPMHISLRSGERLFLNGAVFRVDRKVTLELLNDATFLLENHVLQVEDTTTPMRQLYFAAQAMLMDPANAAASRALFTAMAADVKAALKSPRLIAGIDEALAQVAGERTFHALKTLRGLFSEEATILGAKSQNAAAVARAAERMGATPLARDGHLRAGNGNGNGTLAHDVRVGNGHPRPPALQ